MAPESHPEQYPDADRFYDGRTGEPITPEQEAEEARRLRAYGIDK